MKRVKKKYLILITIFIIPVFIYGTFTFAKYVTERYFSYYSNSKDFYFSSNILTEDNPLYQVNNWLGIGQFSINFDLLSKKNEYVYSNYDIAYEASVTCPNDVICEIDKPNGVIYSSSHSDTIQINVVPTRLYTEGERVNIQIVARTTSPYVKEISARFEYVVGKTGVTYEIDDKVNSPYLSLKITNAINYCVVIEAFDDYNLNDAIDVENYMKLSSDKKKKCVSKYANISFDPWNVYLDTTGEILKKTTYTTMNYNGKNYVNSMRFALEPQSSVEIKFYKVYSWNNYSYPNGNSTSIINTQFQDPS